MFTIQDLEAHSKTMANDVSGKDIEMPELKGSFSELVEVGSSKEFQELDEKIIEFIPDDKAFFDDIMDYYNDLKDKKIREYEINAPEVEQAVLNLLTKRLQNTDIYSIPLMNKVSYYYDLAKSAIEGNEYIDPYIVQPIIPYELFKRDTIGKTEVDISTLDWYVPIMSELIRYYELSMSEAYGRTYTRYMPYDKDSDKYKQRWKYFHRILIAIIETQAELHVYVDAQYNNALWWHQQKGRANIQPFLPQMFTEKAKRVYHTYCKYRLSLMRIPSSKVTTELEQSISPLLSGNWQLFIIKRSVRAFNNFLLSLDQLKQASLFWDGLEDRITRYHSKNDTEIDTDFLSGVVCPNVIQFYIVQAFTNNLMMFPKELWRGIDWDDTAIGSYDEQAFHQLSIVDGRVQFADIKSEKAPFLQVNKVCKFAYGVLSYLVDKAVEEGKLPSRNLYLPLSKSFKITSYTQLLKVKDYMFSFTPDEVMEEITGKEIEDNNIMEVIKKISAIPNTNRLISNQKPTIYDENYDWENEFDWSEYGE